MSKREQKSKARRAAERAIRKIFVDYADEWMIRVPGLQSAVAVSYEDSANCELKKLRAAYVAGYEAARRGER